jgi:Methyladenine glycosylase
MPKKTPKGAPPVKASKPTPPERIPRVIDAATLDDHLEIMTRAIFQAGLSWALIDARWDAFRTAFEDFNVTVIATYGEGEVERLMEAEGVVHSRSKIAGTIANAKALKALVAEFGDVAGYARSFASYEALHADAKKRFAFLGDLNCYYWLFRTRLPVPSFERWMENQPSDHPRMREMVLMGRSEGRSSENSP